MQDKYLRKLDIKLIDGEFENPIKQQVATPEQMYEIFKKIKDQSQETLIGVFLTENLEVRAYNILTLGGQSTTLFIPEQVFEHAILLKSRMFILIHNHPKGDPTPSPEDRKMIEILTEQSKTMNRVFLDLIIVGADSYWSMFEDMDGGDYSNGAVT